VTKRSHINRGTERPAQPAQPDVQPDKLEAAIAYNHFAVILATLMSGRRQRVTAARLPKFVRAKLDELRANDLIDLEHGVHRASDVALYSSCQRRRSEHCQTPEPIRCQQLRSPLPNI
jgi:hypothetical protein